MVYNQVWSSLGTKDPVKWRMLVNKANTGHLCDSVVLSGWALRVLLPAAHFQCLMFTNMRMMMVMVYWPLKNNNKNKEEKKESFAWICLKVCQHVVACQCFTLQTVTQNLSLLLNFNCCKIRHCYLYLLSFT
jgi:hypothetical protein